MNKFLILFVLAQYLNALSLTVDKKGVCLQITAKKNQMLTISYVVSGISEDQMLMTLSDNNRVLLKQRNGKESIVSEQLTYSGFYQVCFNSTDSNSKQVSFDFDIEGYEKNYATSESMTTIEKKLINSHRELIRVYRNQHFQSDRENEHEIILEKTDRYVKICGIGKIIVVIIMCIIQIMVLNSFFKRRQGLVQTVI